MRQRISLAIFVLATSSIVLVPDLAPAKGFGKCARRTTCPPYFAPNFGFFPTQWRTWPEVSAPSPEPDESSVELVPPPAPAPEEATKEEPTKDKKEVKKPEESPLPKPNSSRILPPISPYAPFLPRDTTESTAAVPSKRR